VCQCVKERECVCVCMCVYVCVCVCRYGVSLWMVIMMLLHLDGHDGVCHDSASLLCFLVCQCVRESVSVVMIGCGVCCGCARWCVSLWLVIVCQCARERVYECVSVRVCACVSVCVCECMSV